MSHPLPQSVDRPTKPRQPKVAAPGLLTSALSGGLVPHDIRVRCLGGVCGRPSVSVGQRGGRLPDWLPGHRWLLARLLRFSACTLRYWIHAEDWGEESDRPIAARRGNHAIRDIVGDAERYSIGACTARIGAVAFNVGSLGQSSSPKAGHIGMAS